MKSFAENKGFTQIDIIVAIFILMLFTTLIASLFYNSYVSSIGNKRNAEATSYLTQIFETIDLINYDDLQDENLGIVSKINHIDSSKISGTYVGNGIEKQELSTPYKVEVEIINYNETEGNEDKEDLVKNITVTIKYNVNKKEKEVYAKRIKTKETVYEDNLGIIPNLLNGMTPLNSENEKQATTKYSSSWFEYSNGEVAEVTLQDDLSINDETGEINNLGSRLVYIPRFAYNIDSDGNKNIKFLNTDNTCKDGSSTKIYAEEENIDNSKYYLPSVFSQDSIQIEGIWIGKYLCKKNTDGNNVNQQIYIGTEEENSNYWTGLTDIEKLEECNNITSVDYNYGLNGQGNCKIVDSLVENMLDKLQDTSYSFIVDEIKENQEEYEGSFRIFIFS